MEASTSNQVQNLQGQIIDLKMKLKVEEMQRVTLSTLYMNQEEKYKKEIEHLIKIIQEQHIQATQE